MSRKQDILVLKLKEDQRVNRVQMVVSHGYGFTSKGRGTMKTRRMYEVYIGCDPIFGCTQHGDLTRYFTNKAEAIRYARMTLPYESENQEPIRIVHNATQASINSVGIHLRDATQWDFYDALETAQKDNFPAIYVHSVAKDITDESKLAGNEGKGA